MEKKTQVFELIEKNTVIANYKAEIFWKKRNTRDTTSLWFKVHSFPISFKKPFAHSIILNILFTNY